MGEYARQQMADDARRMFGGDWEPEDFEDAPPAKIKPACARCGKKFRTHLAVCDHTRDKHKPKIAAHTGSAPAAPIDAAGEPKP